MPKKKSVAKQKRDMNGWRSLKDDPPGQEHRMFFIGSSSGGRTDYVFRWPHKGKMAFWCQGEDGNYPLANYGADVWYPGPPEIPGSWRAALHGED
jgi:hypothetical protein